jgi:hypothetical protein
VERASPWPLTSIVRNSAVTGGAVTDSAAIGAAVKKDKRADTAETRYIFFLIGGSFFQRMFSKTWTS